MHRIFKYQFSLANAHNGDYAIQAPHGNVLLVDHESNDMPTIWIEQNGPTGEMTTYIMRGTGQQFDPAGSEHVGSARCGPYVWHVYRLTA